MVGSETSAGSGNRRAEQDLASIDVTRILFRVRSEVAQALARLQTAWARVPQTKMGLIQATESADKNFIGLRETTRPAGELLRVVVRPQEDVAALIALNLAFEQYSAAVNQYNAAQFELYRGSRPASPVGYFTGRCGRPNEALDSDSAPAQLTRNVGQPPGFPRDGREVAREHPVAGIKRGFPRPEKSTLLADYYCPGPPTSGMGLHFKPPIA